MLSFEEIINYITLADSITKWGYIVSSIISLIFNPIAAGIYLSKTFKGQSMRVYNPAILISDIVPLVLGSSFYWAHYLFVTNEIYCKVVIYLSNVTPIFSSWISAILAVDRVLFIFYPNRFTFLKKLKFQCACIIFAFILPSILILQLVIQLVPSPFNNPLVNCVYLTPPGYNSQIYFIVYFICFALLPFLIMIICSTLMIAKLKKIKKNVGKTNDAETSKLNRKFSRSVLGSNVFFLISVLPYCILNIISFILQSQNAVLLDTYAYLSLSYSISNLLLYIYYSTPIIIHILCNRLFRQTFMRCFSCLIRNFQSIDQYYPTSSATQPQI